MKIKSILLVAVVALALTGCRSSRHAEKGKTDLTELVNPTPKDSTTTTTSKTGKTSSTQKQAANTNVKGLSAKMSLKLAAGKKSITCGGTYRLLRDDVVQINLTYNVLIVPVNVGTLELTADSILVLDRINKRYCRAGYDEIAELKKEGVDFGYLQGLFWGDTMTATKSIPEVSYDNWTSLSNGKFPQNLTFSLKSGSTTYNAAFELSNLQETTKWDNRTEISKKYTAVPLKTVINALMSVAK